LIVILTNIPTPYRTAFFDEVARQCVERGVGFKVLYCAQTEPNRHWPFEPEKMKHPFEVLPGWHFNAMGAYFHINPSIISSLKQLKPSVVVCGGFWHMPASVLASLKYWGGPYRAVHGTEGHEDAIRIKTGPIAWARRRALLQYDAFAVPNNRSAAWIKGQTKSDARIVRLVNTVDDDSYRRIDFDERNRAREALSIPKDKVLILQVSQLSARKGVIELARAVTRLPEHFTHRTMLAFAGTGDLAAELRQHADANPNRLRLAGHLPLAGVRQWLMAADWFALNTHFDPNPLTPIEASFAELPLILARKAGNFDELVVEGKTGFAIENAADPAPALIKALSVPNERAHEMGKAAFANVQANFQKSQAAKNYVDDLLAL
jgi:glycosyltransferase involved in cell wall biosynthesis